MLKNAPGLFLVIIVASRTSVGALRHSDSLPTIVLREPHTDSLCAAWKPVAVALLHGVGSLINCLVINKCDLLTSAAKCKKESI